jgi:hypothetical protein
VLPQAVDGAVLVRRRQHLVARTELERTSDNVHARRRVRDEDEVVRPGAEFRRKRCLGLLDQLRVAPREELDGLEFQHALPPLVLLEHRPRTGAERAVVEEDHVRGEQE